MGEGSFTVSERQKVGRFEICSSLLLRNKNDPFLHRIVTFDEKWIMYDNRKRSGQWLDKDEPPTHFPKAKIHQTKVMVTVYDWFMYSIPIFNDQLSIAAARMDGSALKFISTCLQTTL
ncbi:hypothetical protein RI129_008856 [Pyrocoelia pectoralis]|uniref:Uncharacterized protein n=1 Tax=Pyrocoelia pectoralis TaxID=417401 RepID=A0AAN7VEX1_9COLE